MEAASAGAFEVFECLGTGEGQGKDAAAAAEVGPAGGRGKRAEPRVVDQGDGVAVGHGAKLGDWAAGRTAVQVCDARMPDRVT